MDLGLFFHVHADESEVKLGEFGEIPVETRNDHAIARGDVDRAFECALGGDEDAVFAGLEGFDGFAALGKAVVPANEEEGTLEVLEEAGPMLEVGNAEYFFAQDADCDFLALEVLDKLTDCVEFRAVAMAFKVWEEMGMAAGFYEEFELPDGSEACVFAAIASGLEVVLELQKFFDELAVELSFWLAEVAEMPLDGVESIANNFCEGATDPRSVDDLQEVV